MATYSKIPLPDMARYGWTDKIIITHADLSDTAATTKTIDLATYTAGLGVTKAAFKLVTAFDGTSTTALALDVGWNGATTDDPDGILDNYELHNDATEVPYGDGNGAAFATLRTGYYPADAGTYQALFTATTANLTDLTSGEVHIYLRLEDLTKV